jgi:hypothetical protein
MGKSSGTETEVKIPKFQKRGIKSGLSAARDLYRNQEYFPDQTYAGFDPLQQEAFGLQQDFARNMLPGLQGQMFGSLGQALDASNVVNNPAVQAGLGAIEDRALQTFGEDILPQLRQQATGFGNQFSSKAEQTERLAARDLQSAISNAQADLLTGSLGDAMRLQGAGLAMAPGLQQAGLMGGNILGGIGSQFQGMDQAAINEAMARHDFPVGATNQYINQLGVLSGGNLGGVTTQGSTGSNTLGNIIGGGLMGQAGGTALGSMLGLTGGTGAIFPLAGAVLGGLLG